ncbi:uncharacterized protein LOC110614690 [Manihot esculenta]|uniref:uncharacterized protein LOC110614690 n=1 Tax=Manihot esculenta TaxID=3983 RepID=UPI001CC6F807|nr:uncharacterized protein LOC110614690 [Manihot esculenta]
MNKSALLTNLDENHQGIIGGEESITIAVDDGKPSVKKLMEEEMFCEEGLKKQMDSAEPKQSNSEYGGNKRKNCKRTNRGVEKTGTEKTLGSSPESQSIIRNKGTNGVGCCFFLTEIKRRLKQAIGKEQQEIAPDGASKRFANKYRARGDSDKKYRENNGRNSLGKDHFFNEKIARPPSAVRKEEKTDMLKECEIDLERETAAYPKNRMANIYVEVKKHLSDMLTSGTGVQNFSSGQVPKSLGRILSFPEYNFSPTGSPGREWGQGLVTAQMRFSSNNEFQKHESNGGHRGRMTLNSETDLCVSNDPAYSQAVTSANPNSSSPCELAQDNEVDKILCTIGDTDMLKECEIDLERETAAYPKNRMANIYVEAKISFPEYNFSPTGSPGREWGQGFVTAQMRFSNNNEFQKHESNGGHRGRMTLNSETDLCVSNDPAYSQAVTSANPNSSSPCELAQDNEVDKILCTIGDTSGGDVDIVKSAEIGVQEDCNISDTLSEPINSSRTGDDQNGDVSEACDGKTFSRCSKHDLNEENQLPLSALTSPSTSPITKNDNNLEGVVEVSERPSPVSVLEPLFTEEVEFFPNQFCYDKKLLFDCVDEVLKDVYGKNFGCPLGLSFAKPTVRPAPDMKNPIHEIWEGVYRYLLPLPLPCTKELIVEKDMAKTGTWMDLRYDSETIITEIGEAIFKDLMEEIIEDIKNSHQHMVIR